MPVHKEVVFLLSSVAYRDSDLVVNFLSEKGGKLSAVIYGGRKLNKGSSFHYQAGDLIELEYEKPENKDFIRVLNAIGVRLLAYDKFSYNRFVFHSYLIEIIMKISRPELSARRLFEVLALNLDHDWGIDHQWPFVTWALWKIIEAGGYQLDFSACSVCQKQAWRYNHGKSPSFRKQCYQIENDTGTIICQNCTSSPSTSSVLTPAMIKILWLYCDNRSYTNMLNNLPESELLPLARLLNRYLISCFEILPRSLESFNSLLAKG